MFHSVIVTKKPNVNLCPLLRRPRVLCHDREGRTHDSPDLARPGFEPNVRFSAARTVSRTVTKPPWAAWTVSTPWHRPRIAMLLAKGAIG
jgi:hypothetical protein